MINFFARRCSCTYGIPAFVHEAVPHLVDRLCVFFSLRFFSIYFSRRFEKRGFHLFSLIFIEIILRFFTLYFFGRFFAAVFCPCRFDFRFFFGQAV